MPVVSAVAKRAAKEAAKKVLRSLIENVIQEAVKRALMKNLKATTRAEATRNIRMSLVDKRRTLDRKFDREADDKITGLPFSLAVNQVFAHASAFPDIDPGKLIDTLIAMIDVIDNAVDAEYRKYARNASLELVEAVILPEAWHPNVTWDPIYSKLRRDLWQRLRKIQASQELSQAQFAKYEPLLKESSAKWHKVKQTLRKMIDEYAKLSADTSYEGLQRRLPHFIAIHRNRMHDAWWVLEEEGSGLVSGQGYDKTLVFARVGEQDRRVLEQIIAEEKAYIARQEKRLETAKTKVEQKEKQCREFEIKLIEQLKELRDHHYNVIMCKLFLNRSTLNANLKGIYIKDLEAPPPLDNVPWRLRGNGRVGFNSTAYPFNMNKP